MSVSTTTLFVPADSAARSLGSDHTADAIAELIKHNKIDASLVRNGSRGLYWLEPLLEVETAAGRIAFGPVSANDVDQLFADNKIPDVNHPSCLGFTADIPALAMQKRITAQRIGLADPLSLQSYLDSGGYSALNSAISLTPQAIVDIVTESGLRGRGGAAFPTGIKWQTVLNTGSDITDSAADQQKYIVCNADEGDSGTFVDRMVMESDPFTLIEGMTIAGLAVGASKGFIYCRSEYPQAIHTLQQAIRIAYEQNYLGSSIGDSHANFDLEIRQAAGAYICGEETALLESLEGKRGMVRPRPPLPAIEGLFGCPTVVNNVVSLASVPAIIADGATAYKNCGVRKSHGTLTVQLSGNIKHGGLYEVEFGLSLREIIEQWGGGSISGRAIRAVQVGGPLGAFIPASQFDISMDYESFAEHGAILGHGGIVVFDDTTDMGKMAQFSMAFCALESCGKCTPCRIGSVRGEETIGKIKAGVDPDKNRALLTDLCHTMIDGSLCAMGSMTPNPVLSVLKHFPEDL